MTSSKSSPPRSVGQLLNDLQQCSPPVEYDRRARRHTRRLIRVAAALCETLGPDAPCEISARIITQLIEDHAGTGTQPLYHERQVDPTEEAFADALRRLDDALKPLIERERRAVLGLTRKGVPRESIEPRERRLARYSNLQTVLRDFSPPMTRREHKNARWHATAIGFADFIEQDLMAAGCPLHSRRSVSSPLVKALQALLAMTDVGHVELDAIRKALGKKSD